MTYTLFALALVGSAFVIAVAVLLLFGTFDHRRTSMLRRFTEEERDSVVYIFENETLLDATPAARQLLDSAPRRGTAWSHLSSILSPQFPRLGELIGDLADVGEMQLTSGDGASRLRAEWHDGVARISLDDADPAEVLGAGYDQHSLLAMSQELKTLRASAENTPFPQWREDRTGAISWCNTAYLTLADNVAGNDEVRPWPPARVFNLDRDSANTRPGRAGRDTSHRAAVTYGPEATRHWFEVSEVTTETGDKLFTAMPADRLVKAETSLQEFVTTLTKTFAALPIGLVIFNRARELALFNPALMDLTMLPAAFLISKPSLSTFLDRLRESRMMPEPKDYKSWRQQMSDLEAAAQNGTYEETWALPTGQTYRVTGRPHPDGAVALLFEDISAEISLTRRFRTELETGQAALDALPQAIAVFSAGGTLSISNSAYGRLWGNDPSTQVDGVTIRDAVAAWEARSAPTPAWEELRAQIARTDRQGTWRTRVMLTDGRTLLTRVTPLTRGATLVDFTVAAAAKIEGKPVPGSRTVPAARNQPDVAAPSPLLV